MTSSIWISYDLGVRGDYEGIYTWLDDHGAKECGDNVAYLTYEHSGTLMEALKQDLEAAVDVTKRTRIYLIYKDAGSGKMKGAFILGGRRAAPWSGFAKSVAQADADEA